MIAIVLGTKAELIKTMPVMKELDERKIPYWFIHTGQHPLSDVLKDFGLKLPDFVLYEPPKLSSRFMVKLNKALLFWFVLIPKIWQLLMRLRPEYVIYHGDTLSAAAAAVASKFAGRRGVHLEAGLRSGSIFEPFPEEISRIICDSFSSVLLAVSDLTEFNLKSGFYGGKIVKVGNTVVDSVRICLESPKFHNLGKDFVLVSIHRYENIISKERLAKIVDIITSVKSNVIWPLHDNTRQQLVKFGLWRKLQRKNMLIMQPRNYREFISLFSDAKYAVVDGGSIQEESLALKKPCILLRKRTERQEGLSTGLNFLTGLDLGRAKEAIQMAENGIFVKNFENPYGDGHSAEKIADFLLK